MTDPRDERPAEISSGLGEEPRRATSAAYPATEQPPAQMAEAVHRFDAGHWFPIYNAAFDSIMPRLSPNAWKVLCVVIRQTWGWVADPDGDPKIRRQWDRISYSQFQSKSGIKSRATVSKALNECLAKGCLLRHQVGTERGRPAYAYALNRDFGVKWPTGIETEPVIPTGSKNEPVTGTETEPATGSRNEPTKQRKTNKQNGDGDLTEEQKRSFHLLVNSGVHPIVASDIVQQSNLADVRDCLDYAQNASGVHSLPALIVWLLRHVKPVPSKSRNSHVKNWRDSSEGRIKKYVTEGVQA